MTHHSFALKRTYHESVNLNSAVGSGSLRTPKRLASSRMYGGAIVAEVASHSNKHVETGI
jgi:hypothetical protein